MSAVDTDPLPRDRGLRVRVEHVDGPPLVACRLWLRAGSLRELVPGQSLVAGRMLTEGTQHRTWQQIAVDAEDRGMALHGFGSLDATGLAVDALAADWRLALDWLAELLVESTFSADRVAWIARQAAAELEGLLDAPDTRTRRAFLEQLYAPHPYARSSLGDAESLASLTPEHCRRFLEVALAEGGCLSVAGAVDEDEVARAVEDRFGGWPVADTERLEPPPPVGLDARRHVPLEDLDDEENDDDDASKPQAHLALGHLTIPRVHPDRPALQIAAVALGAGAGISGRIPHRVREREGLSYSAEVALTAGAGFAPGRLQVVLGTAPSQVEHAEAVVREELDRFLAEGPTDDEIESARAYLAGREPFRRETVRQRADRMAEAALYGAPIDDLDWIVAGLERVTRDDVVEAIRRWIRPEALRVTVGSSAP